MNTNSSPSTNPNTNLKCPRTFSTINVLCPECPNHLSTHKPGNQYSNNSHLASTKKSQMSHVPDVPTILHQRAKQPALKPTSPSHLRKNHKCPMSQMSRPSLASIPPHLPIFHHQNHNTTISPYIRISMSHVPNVSINRPVYQQFLYTPVSARIIVRAGAEWSLHR